MPAAISLRQKHYVALQGNQVLAAVDHQCGAGNCARSSEVANGSGDIFRRAGFTQRCYAVCIGKAGGALIAGLHGQAGCNADHAQFRRQCLRQHGGGGMQCGFRKRVGQEIGIQVKQFLVQQVDHYRLRAVRRGGMQRTRQ
jgi:hypothetical protein